MRFYRTKSKADARYEQTSRSKLKLTVVVGEVTTLAHKSRNDTVEWWSSESESLLACIEL